MKQQVLLNITYYITKYHLSSPLVKILIFFIISISIRQGLDLSNYTYCMEDPPVETLPRSRRLSIPSATTSTSDELHHLRAELKLRDDYINKQNVVVRSLRALIDRQRYKLLSLSADNENMTRDIESYREQNIELAKELNNVKMKLRRTEYSLVVARRKLSALEQSIVSTATSVVEPTSVVESPCKSAHIDADIKNVKETFFSKLFKAK